MNEQERKLQDQLQYLRKLKSMKESKLRSLHDSVFIGTRFAVKVPRWMHRSVVERRLFYYYCVRHYHYEKDHPIAVEFRKKAKFILSAAYVNSIDPVEQAKHRLKEISNFTVTNIKAMPIVEVDRYLASLSLFVEGSETTRRKVLWEWFNEPSNKLITHFNDKGKKVAARNVGNLNNKFKLRDLILKNPTLCFSDFMEAFGAQMPTVTRNSFKNTRCLLRKAGYDIPVFPRTVNPVVVTGPYGHPMRARMLDDSLQK